MKLKTYVAQDLNEALAQVKKDLGPEAVILSTNSRRVPGPGTGWPRTEIEVKAALDPEGLTGSDAYHFPEESSSMWTSARPSLQQVHEEVKELKDLMFQLVKQNGPPSWLLPYDELVSLYRVLVNFGLSSQILKSWLENLPALIAAQEQHPLTLKREALFLLMKAFEVKDLWESKKPGPRFWTFLGPTGVGKTTTIAKLAVHFSLALKKRVAMISLDNGRLGGHDQLAAYGRLTGLPLAVVSGRKELCQTLEKMRDLELVLIDTPGRNPQSLDSKTALRKLLSGLPELEHNLVLSATWSEENLAAAINGFNTVSLRSFIITKIDEACDFTGVFNQLCHHCVPLSYLTHGQQVPDDIEPASPQKVMTLLFQGNRSNGNIATTWDTDEQTRYAQ